VNERRQLCEELLSIARRYDTGSELRPIAGTLFIICGVLASGDPVALLNHMAKFSKQELKRLQAEQEKAS
jgi:hypothetical protein